MPPDPMQRANLDDIHAWHDNSSVANCLKNYISLYLGACYSASHHVTPYKYDIALIFIYDLQLPSQVLITKDNLIKRKWQGSEKCCFCDQKETVQYLFIQCPLAKMLWRIVYMALSIIPPTNIKNKFGN
jgi:hypothetical protein